MVEATRAAGTSASGRPRCAHAAEVADGTNPLPAVRTARIFDHDAATPPAFHRDGSSCNGDWLRDRAFPEMFPEGHSRGYLVATQEKGTPRLRSGVFACQAAIMSQETYWLDEVGSHKQVLP